MTQTTFQEENFDLRRVIFRFLPFWPHILGSLLVAIGLAYLFNNIKEPVYKVESTLLISDKSKGLSRGSLLDEFDKFSTRSNFHDNIVILQSFSLIEKALNKMPVDVYYFEPSRFMGLKRKKELYVDSPFTVTLEAGGEQPFEKEIFLTIVDQKHFVLESKEIDLPKDKIAFASQVSGKGFSFRVSLNENFNPKEDLERRFFFVTRDKPKLVREYAGALSVKPFDKTTWVLKASFNATNLKRAKDFLNSLNASFVNMGLEEKNQTALNAIAFIEEQLSLVQDSLVVAETRLQKFRQSEKLISVSQVGTLLLDELQVLEQEKFTEDLKMRQLENLEGYLKNNADLTDGFAPANFGLSDPVLLGSINQLVKLYSDRKTMLVSVREGNPALEGNDRQIGLARKTLAENIQNIKSTSAIKLAEINKRIALNERRMNRFPDTERELLGIQRLFNVNDGVFNFLLKKREEANLALASNIADNQVIDSATPRGVISPNKGRNIIIAFILGLLIPVGLIELRFLFNTRIVDRKEVTDALPFAIAGIIPHLEGENGDDDLNLVVYEKPRSQVVEAFRTLRANLQFIVPGEKSKVFAITSTRSGEGKSFSASNLATAFALTGKKTILVMADMRKPKLAKALGAKIDPGLSNFLIGQLDHEKVIQATKVDTNLFLIASGPVPPNSAELIATNRMNKLIEGLRQEYDYVVIDTPPLGLIPDAMPLTNMVDAIIYVIRQGLTDRSALDFIKDFSEKTSFKNICIEINDIKKSKFGARYGYDFGYGYGRGYGYGYGYHEGKDRIDRGFLANLISRFKGLVNNP